MIRKGFVAVAGVLVVGGWLYSQQPPAAPNAGNANPEAPANPNAGQPNGEQGARGARGERGGNRGAGRGPNVDSQYRLGPDSLRQENVPHGKFEGPFIIPSEAYPGTQHTYHVYVPAQYDPAQPACLMVMNDGQAMMHEDLAANRGDVRVHNVLDNLIYRREIPVMLCVCINPGRTPQQPEPHPGDWGDRTTNRGEEYNRPDDKYAKVICDELLPQLKKQGYNISSNPDHRGIGGASSGAIAAFKVAWERPEEFRKVLSIVGSFVDLRGGHVYPERVLESEKKPIRMFFVDGRNDNRGRGANGSNNDWFFQNVRLATAMEKKGYDVNYIWGIGNHGQKQGGAQLPEMMRWLWRDLNVNTDPNDMVERSFRAAVTPPATPAVTPPATQP